MTRRRPRVTLSMNGEETLAQQHFKNECDINNIMAKFQTTGVIDHISKYGAQYGDAPSPDHFRDSMNMIAEAKTMFEELPSKARRYFKEDPANFLAFIEESDPDAVASKFAELGLMRDGYTYEPPSDEIASDELTEPPTPINEGDAQ